MKKGKHYKLIDFSSPIIRNNTNMLCDNNKGGTILTYKVTEIRYISLRTYNWIIRSARIYETLVFFKPLKKNWDRKAYMIKKHDWGRKNHLLTKLWLIVGKDFKDIFSVTSTQLATFPECEDKNLIKELNNRNDSFILSNNQNR